MTSGAASVAASLIRVDRARIARREAVFAAIVASAWGSACVALGRPQDAVFCAFGVMFGTVVDIACGAAGRKARLSALAVASSLFSLGVLVGTSVAAVPPAVVALGSIVALVAGLATAYGAVAGLTGMLATVLVLVASGTAQAEFDAVVAALACLAGSLTTLLLPLLWPRGGTRISVTGPSCRALLLEPSVARRHAARYAVAIGAATACSQALPTPHPYWIPVTVAWVLKPDAATTARIAVHRLLGALAGAVFIATLIDITGLQGVALVIASACAGALWIAFLWSHYAIATAGFTALVVGLVELSQAPLRATAREWIIDTAIAIALVAVMSLAWRDAPRQSSTA